MTKFCLLFSILVIIYLHTICTFDGKTTIVGTNSKHFTKIGFEQNRHINEFTNNKKCNAALQKQI